MLARGVRGWATFHAAARLQKVGDFFIVIVLPALRTPVQQGVGGGPKITVQEGVYE